VALTESDEEPAEVTAAEAHDEEPVQVAEALVETAQEETANEEPTVERSKEVRNYLNFIESSAQKIIEFIDQVMGKARKFLEG